MPEITFQVLGEPKPAGSKRAFPFRRADNSLGVRVVHDNAKTKSWMQDVACVAKEAMGNQELISGAIALRIEFERPRPKGHFGKNGLNKHGLESPFPTTRPDTVKLTRAVEDALTGVIWNDDSQVVNHRLIKRWGNGGYRTLVTVFYDF